MDVDDPLDLEMEDSPLSVSPAFAMKKRRKLIGLDDLLNDHKEEEKYKRKKSKVANFQKCYSSDDDEDKTEIQLSKAVDNFQQMIKEIDGDEAANIIEEKSARITWGLRVFGTQKMLSSPLYPDIRQSKLLQASVNNGLSSLVELSLEEGSDEVKLREHICLMPIIGETFLRGLLLNNLLQKLVLECGHVEESIARWTFNLLVQLPEESLRSSACEFWCAILLCNEAETTIHIEWLPTYSQLKKALESFGFLLYSPDNGPCIVEWTEKDFDCKEPPSNVRAWIKFVNACFLTRDKHQIFSIPEAEELVGVVVCLSLDRRLQGLSLTLYDCLLSAVHFFEEREWNSSSGKVAKFLVDRVPRDLNCLKMVEIIPGVDVRSRKLKTAIAFEILTTCFCDEVTDAQDILKLIISVNMKDKSCNLFQIHLYLVLIENWLILGIQQNETLINDLWGAFLRNCCSQITNTDFRPYAQEVRNRASYLLQEDGKK